MEKYVDSQKTRRMFFLYNLGIEIPNIYKFAIDKLNEFFDVGEGVTVKKTYYYDYAVEYRNKFGEYAFKIFKDRDDGLFYIDTGYYYSKIKREIGYAYGIMEYLDLETDYLSTLVLKKKGFEFQKFI